MSPWIVLTFVHPLFKYTYADVLLAYTDEIESSPKETPSPLIPAPLMLTGQYDGFIFAVVNSYDLFLSSLKTIIFILLTSIAITLLLLRNALIRR